MIPTLGRTAALGDVLAGLAAQRGPLRDAEVLVALDAVAPPGDPLGFERASGLPLELLRAERPGASAARNAGWRRASGALVLFLDDDIVPAPELVAKHLAWHDRHPAAEVAVLGLVRWSPRVTVTPFMRWLEMGVQFDYGAIDGVEAGWGRLYSCNVSLKRALLELVGGFDEVAFPFGYEDLDLGCRLADHGLRLLLNRAAVGYHLKTETLAGWSRNLRRIAIAERQFVARHPEVPAYFHERFLAAAAAPPVGGRWARLARVIAPAVPWLGPRVWHSFDALCWQRLAPEFLAAWDAGA